MTRRWPELGVPVMFELRAFAEHRTPQIGKFALDWMDDAVEWAAQMNGIGCNIYAVRNPIRADFTGSAKDTDIVAAFALWADCDDGEAAANVRNFVGPKWTSSVITGTVPTTRVHTYWELAEPITDMAAWRATQAAIAATFQSDPAVINPSRIMRVGGTVSHPFEQKRQRGYISELCTIRTEYDDARAPVPFETMQRLFSGAVVAPRPVADGFTIDTGTDYAPPLDRERLAIQAMSGQDWHNAVIRIVASYVARGLSDSEIHALTDPLTLAGYTVDQTRAEVQVAIDGARRKGWTPTPTYADPAAISVGGVTSSSPPQSDASFDAPKRASNLEWFDDIEVALSAAYLAKGVLDQGAMSVVYGPSNSGKTFFALDLAFHLAIGARWRGRRVTPAVVLYLAAEGGRGVTNRIAALKATAGVLDVPLALKRAGLDLLHDTADLQHICDLTAEIVAKYPGRPVLIVIDTLSRIMAGGDENSAADMTALIRNVDAIRAATGAHIMLVHHTGKDAARGARGHSSLRAATDTEIEVQAEGESRAAVVSKQRDNPGGETFAFTLKSVSLGHDQDGDEVTSCVVEVADDEEYKVAQKAAKGRGKNQQIIMDTFDQMVSEGLATGNPGGVGMPEPGQFWAVQTAELRRIAQGKMVGDSAPKLFRQAWEALTARDGIFCTGDNLAWRIDRRKQK